MEIKASLDYHSRQHQKMYFSTKFILSWIKNNLILKDGGISIDIGCGGGAVTNELAKLNQKHDFLGIDIDNKAIELAKEKNTQVNCKYEVKDFTESSFNNKTNNVFAIQFLTTSNLTFERFLEICSKFEPENIIITSLFTEFFYEQVTYRKDLKRESNNRYSIESIPKCKEIAKEFGFEFTFKKIEEKELLPDSNDPMTTRSVLLKDNSILHISGYLVMPWYLVCLRKILK